MSTENVVVEKTEAERKAEDKVYYDRLMAEEKARHEAFNNLTDKEKLEAHESLLCELDEANGQADHYEKSYELVVKFLYDRELKPLKDNIIKDFHKKLEAYVQEYPYSQSDIEEFEYILDKKTI